MHGTLPPLGSNKYNLASGTNDFSREALLTHPVVWATSVGILTAVTAGHGWAWGLALALTLIAIPALEWAWHDYQYMTDADDLAYSNAGLVVAACTACWTIALALTGYGIGLVALLAF